MPDVMTIGNAAQAHSQAIERGIEAIRLFRECAPNLEGAFKAITELGGPESYIALSVALMSFLGPKRGSRPFMALLISHGLNAFIKNALRVPRPFHVVPGVNLIAETGWSFPSAHAQNSAVFWTIVAFGLIGVGVSRGKSASGRNAASGRGRALGHKGAVTAMRVLIAVAIPLLIGASRVYLGVHYPTDVLAGWAIGYALALVGLIVLPRLWKPLSPRVQALPSKARANLILASSAAVSVALNAATKDPLSGGLFFGLGLALATAERLGEDSFQPRSALTAALTAVLGATGLALILAGGKLILPTHGSDYYAIFRFARYCLAAFWIAFGAQWAVRKRTKGFTARSGG